MLVCLYLCVKQENYFLCFYVTHEIRLICILKTMFKLAFLSKPITLAYLNSATSATVKFHLSSSKLAGHSKWANIKHTKGLKDAQRATEFQRLSRTIRLAVQGKMSILVFPNLKLNIKYSIHHWRYGLFPQSVQPVLKSR